MAIQFLNEVWATRLLMDLEQESVWKMLGNQNYQADASNAKQVHLGKMTNDITVGNYAVDRDIPSPQLVDSSDAILVMDKQKYINFYVDSIVEAQSTPSFMTEAMRKAAIAVSIQMDTDISNTVTAGLSSTNNVSLDWRSSVLSGLPVGQSAGRQLIQAFIDIKKKMREANIAKSTVPWAVLSPSHMSMLEEFLLLDNTDLFIPATTEQTLRNGYAGRLLGVDIYWSNNFSKAGSTTSRIIVGTTDAFTYADNVTEVSSYKPEKRFGDAVKGLYVYGTKVTDNKQLFSITTRNR